MSCQSPLIYEGWEVSTLKFYVHGVINARFLIEE